MKNLIVIRHAKSSWDEPGLTDFERPLNKRGKRDAPFMGNVLKFRGLIPDLVITSTAKRARKTAQLIVEALGCGEEVIEPRDSIYLAEAADLLDLIRGLDDKPERVFLVGHNPTLTELVNLLAGESIDNIPTCGVASLEFALDSWAHVMEGAARMAFFDYPKRHL